VIPIEPVRLGYSFSVAPGRRVIAATVLGPGMAGIDATVVGIDLARPDGNLALNL
jgi:hypothetical protein